MKTFITIVALILIGLAPIFASETNTTNTNENPQIVLVYVNVGLAPIFANETNTTNTNENPQIVLVYVNGIWLVTYADDGDDDNDIIL